MRRLHNSHPHPPLETAFAFGPISWNDRTDWEFGAGSSPVWPPPPPGSDHDPTTAKKPLAFTLRLAESMHRFSGLLHSWLRPHFLDPDFLATALKRYDRFLALHAAHPHATLVPAADIALLWHTHLGLSESYAAECVQRFGGGGGDVEAAEEAGEALWRPDYLDLDDVLRQDAYNKTAALYEEAYGEPYDCPDTAPIPLTVPHPLAAPGSPLAFALRAFDEEPREDAHQISVHYAKDRAAACGVDVQALFPEDVHEEGPPRAGAHALFAAWVASSRSSEFFDDETCKRRCFTSSWSIRVGTITRAVTPLVTSAYFLEVPSYCEHPFLLAIRQRRGLWKRLPAADASVTPQDAEAFLDDPCMLGVSQLLLHAHATAVPPGRVSSGGIGDLDGDRDSAGSRHSGGGSGKLLRPASSGGAAANKRTSSGGGAASSRTNSGGGGRDTRDVAALPDQYERDEAPLWGLLRMPQYQERFCGLWAHLWSEAAENGIEAAIKSAGAHVRDPYVAKMLSSSSCGMAALQDFELYGFDPRFDLRRK